MSRAKVTLRAVHDVDLEKVLRKLGIYESIIRGERKCSICGRPTTLDNLGGLYRDDDGTIKLVCNDIKCLYKTAEIVAGTGKD